jgi:hypothetical protein
MGDGTQASSHIPPMLKLHHSPSGQTPVVPHERPDPEDKQLCIVCGLFIVVPQFFKSEQILVCWLFVHVPQVPHCQLGLHAVGVGVGV